MKLSPTTVAKLDVAAVQSSAGLRCSKVNGRPYLAWRCVATRRPEGGIWRLRDDWRAGDPMQRAGVLRGAPEVAGELGRVPGAYGAADGGPPGGCTRRVRSNWTSQTDRGRRKQSQRRISAGTRLAARAGQQAADGGVLGGRRASFSRHSGRLGVLGRVRGQQLSFATDDSMSAACLAWTGAVQFQGRGGDTTSRMETRTSSAQPVVWTCVRPRDVFEAEELAAEWRASSNKFDQQGQLWEGPINEDSDAQNKACRTWESFNRGLVYLNKPV